MQLFLAITTFLLAVSSTSSESVVTTTEPTDAHVLESSSTSVFEETTIGPVKSNVDSASNTTEVARKLMETYDVRFNKFTGDPRGFKPLKANQYPVSGYVYDVLTETTDAMDVFMIDDEKVRKYDVMSIVEKLGGLPSHPEEDEGAHFWDMLREVIDVRQIRIRSPRTELFPRSELWRDYTLDDCAEAVHNEVPGTIQQEFIDAMFDERWGYVDIDLNIFPHSCHKNHPWSFFENALAAANQWTIETVMPPTFSVKWYAGRARPEEVIWAIKKGKIHKGVPRDIMRFVNWLDIASQYEFTAYEEGSPKHPSWPAMHAASGSCSLFVAVMLDLNDEQLCQARLTDYAIAYSRTIAGVHYPDDNVMGLNFAQEIIGQALPRYLRDKYGADPKYVERKIEQYKFDWNEFDPEDPCPFLRGGHDYCYFDPYY